MRRRLLFSLIRPVFKRLYGSRLARAIWLVPGSRRLYLALISRTRPSHVQVRGHELQLDALDSMMLSVLGEYEDLELDIFSRCIHEGETVVDVGAHIGLYTLEAARAVGTTGKVLAFEPDPKNFELLQANVTRNGYANVDIIQAAAAGEAGKAILRHSSENTGDHRLVASSGQHDGENVTTVSIDEVVASHGLPSVSVMKMDIQGAEPEALRGAGRLTSESANLILFTEVSPSHLEAWGGARAYLNELSEIGFDLYRIDADAKRVEPVDPTRIDVEPRADNREEHTNLVCAKGPGAVSRMAAAIAG